MRVGVIEFEAAASRFSGQARIALAEMEAEAGNDENAVLAYRALLGQVGKNDLKARAWKGLGDAYLRLRQYDDALEAYRHVLASKPTAILNFEARSQIGTTLELQGKLEAALDRFQIHLNDKTILDVGASTGGFTDCLLQHGARRVIAVDVGYGQFHWKLRQDPRVVVMEGINARHLGPGDLPFPVDLACVDVSFISLRLVVPPVMLHVAPGGRLICLVKPQFEAGRDQVESGGVVRDGDLRRQVVASTVLALEESGLELVGTVPSPIRGPKGNLEELAVFRRSSEFEIRNSK